MSNQTVALKDAKLCLDCETISSAKASCPACGAISLWPLAAWIKQNSSAAAA